MHNVVAQVKEATFETIFSARIWVREVLGLVGPFWAPLCDFCVFWFGRSFFVVVAVVVIDLLLSLMMICCCCC